MKSPPDCGGPYTLDVILLRKFCDREIEAARDANRREPGAMAAFAEAALIPALEAIRADIDAGRPGAEIFYHIQALLEIIAPMTAASMVGGAKKKGGALLQMCDGITEHGARRIPLLMAAYGSDVESVN